MGTGIREPGDLVPEADDWDPRIAKSHVDIRRLEVVTEEAARALGPPGPPRPYPDGFRDGPTLGPPLLQDGAGGAADTQEPDAGNDGSAAATGQDQLDEAKQPVGAAPRSRTSQARSGARRRPTSKSKKEARVRA
jgi:hypothetical protein